MYMRDFEAAREARTLYDAEVASLNAADAMKQSAEAPQASGAWAWS
jgi:flagellar biosynthesis regulator FlbT